MDSVRWIFSGIGVEILKVLIGAIVGGGVGYTIGMRRIISQSQTAADNSEQKQKANVVVNQSEKGIESGINQKQSAGKDSKQVQVGTIENGKQ